MSPCALRSIERNRAIHWSPHYSRKTKGSRRASDKARIRSLRSSAGRCSSSSHPHLEQSFHNLHDLPSRIVLDMLTYSCTYDLVKRVYKAEAARVPDIPLCCRWRQDCTPLTEEARCPYDDVPDEFRDGTSVREPPPAVRSESPRPVSLHSERLFQREPLP